MASGDAGGEAQTSPATSFLGLGFGDSLFLLIHERILFSPSRSTSLDRLLIPLLEQLNRLGVDQVVKVFSVREITLLIAPPWRVPR